MFDGHSMISLILFGNDVSIVIQLIETFLKKLPGAHNTITSKKGYSLMLQ